MALPSIDRFLTELPSHLSWDYGMVADQPYIPSSPSSYIYQIEDPNANYIYSTDFWGKKDYVYTKPKVLMRSSNSTPTPRPNSRFRSNTPVTLATTYTPVIRQYYINDEYYGNVYTTPYEFSRFVVQPNVLYSGYLTKPVYVVNNAFNSVPWNIYQYPKQYVYELPFFYAPKIDHKVGPNLYQQIKKPVETNLTKVNIDPISEPRSNEERPISSGIVHKQRRVNNAYGIIYHKMLSQ